MHINKCMLVEGCFFSFKLKNYFARAFSWIHYVGSLICLQKKGRIRLFLCAVFSTGDSAR